MANIQRGTGYAKPRSPPTASQLLHSVWAHSCPPAILPSICGAVPHPLCSRVWSPRQRGCWAEWQRKERAAAGGFGVGDSVCRLGRVPCAAWRVLWLGHCDAAARAGLRSLNVPPSQPAAPGLQPAACMAAPHCHACSLPCAYLQWPACCRRITSHPQALQCCLGVRAAATGRYGSLKKFVQSEDGHAVIRLTLVSAASLDLAFSWHFAALRCKIQSGCSAALCLPVLLRMPPSLTQPFLHFLLVCSGTRAQMRTAARSWGPRPPSCAASRPQAPAALKFWTALDGW